MTMDDEIIYIPNDDKLDFPFCVKILTLLISTNQNKKFFFKLTNKYVQVWVRSSNIYVSFPPIMPSLNSADIKMKIKF